MSVDSAARLSGPERLYARVNAMRADIACDRARLNQRHSLRPRGCCSNGRTAPLTFGSLPLPGLEAGTYGSRIKVLRVIEDLVPISPMALKQICKLLIHRRETKIGSSPAAIIVFLFSGVAFGQIISVSQLGCSPSGLSSGASTTCTVTLSGLAPTGGTEVLLSSNNTLLRLGSNSVIVPAGMTSTTFTATAGSVGTNQNATLTATALYSVLLNWTASTSPNLTNYKVYRGTTTGGPYPVVTTLGLMANYTDSNIQNGQTYYYVSTAVDSTGAESAYSNEASAVVPNGVSQSAAVSLVTSVTLSSLACSPTSLNSGSATKCTVTLKAAPSGATVVGLASNNNLLPVPAPSVTVPAAATSTTFTATAGSIGSNQSATLTASLNGALQTATVSLVAPVMLSSLTCNPTSLNAGAKTTCTVALSGGASNGGIVVALASSSARLTVPPSVTVVAASSSATFTATAGYGTSQRATITASFGGGRASVSVIIGRRR